MTKRILLPTDSRYLETDLFQISDRDGTKYSSFMWGIWEPIRFEENQDDIIHTVRQVDIGRLDLLANIYYGNVNLWWVIAYENHIMDPFEDMKVGDQLRIIARDVVFAKLLGARGAKRSDEEVGV